MASRELTDLIGHFVEMAKIADTSDKVTDLLVGLGTEALSLALDEITKAEELFLRSHEEHSRAVEVVKQLHANEKELQVRVLLAADYILEQDNENTTLKRQQRETAARVRDLETHLRAERTARGKVTDRLQALTNGDEAPIAAVDSDEVARLTEELRVVCADRDLYRELLGEAEEERNDAVAARARLAATLTELQADQGDLEVTTVTGPAQQRPVPATFAEVLEQAAHPLLVFSLDPHVAAALDSHPHAPAWRSRTTDALATLAAYAAEVAAARAAGRQRGPELANFLAYVRQGGPDIAISAGMVALGESRRVTDGPHAQARMFPVPTDMHPDGQVAMYAHLRIGGVRPPAVRLHVYFDTEGTGKIACGYLGPHLPTSRSN